VIGYVTLGVSSIERARQFYDALLSTIGAKRLMELEQNGFTQYGTGWDKPTLVITEPFEGLATSGNGVMIALPMDSREKVNAFYAKGIELGAICNGPPGPREPASLRFYAAYFRDPDGNKLCAYKVG
jgi:predicted lactoylglutathione lyase